MTKTNQHNIMKLSLLLLTALFATTPLTLKAVDLNITTDTLVDDAYRLATLWAVKGVYENITIADGVNVHFLDEPILNTSTLYSGTLTLCVNSTIKFYRPRSE